LTWSRIGRHIARVDVTLTDTGVLGRENGTRVVRR
jgi:hypothetical protein